MSDRFPTEGEQRHYCSACGCTRLVSPDGKPSVCSGIGCRNITRDLDAEQQGLCVYCGQPKNSGPCQARHP